MEQADRDRRLSEAFVEISEKRSRRIDTKADGSCLYHALVRLIRVERRWDLLGQPDAPLPESACENIGGPATTLNSRERCAVRSWTTFARIRPTLRR